jgi:ABC-type Fe3+ transport system substrate-binding protein
MRKFAFIAAFVLLLAPPLAAYWLNAQPARSKETGADRLVIVTANNQDIRNEFRWAFSKWHEQKYGRPVELVFLSVGGTNDIKRQIETIYRQIKQSNGGNLPAEDDMDVGIQLVWGGGDSFFDRELKPLNVLRPLALDAKTLAEIFPRPDINGVNLYDREKNAAGQFAPPKWVGTCLSSFGIIYNPDLYRAMGLSEPTTWGDLADPRLMGSVALADPTHSGSAAVAYMMVVQRAMADAEAQFLQSDKNRGKPIKELKASPGYRQALDEGWKNGMRRLLLIAANARYFVDAAPQVPMDVAGGNAAAGVAIDFFGRVTEDTVGPGRARFVLPAGASAITPDPIAILYGTHGQKLDLANHFVEFVLSPQGQRLWILKAGQPGGPIRRSLCRPPIRQSVYADRTGWTSTVDYFSAAGGFNQRSQWMVTLSDIRVIWSAAWIDDRDELRKAYQAVLAVSDPMRRQMLIDELADLPITRGGVEDMMSQRKAIESDTTKDSDLWKARLRIDWANKFKAHYRQVADEAFHG